MRLSNWKWLFKFRLNVYVVLCISIRICVIFVGGLIFYKTTLYGVQSLSAFRIGFDFIRLKSSSYNHRSASIAIPMYNVTHSNNIISGVTAPAVCFVLYSFVSLCSF